MTSVQIPLTLSLAMKADAALTRAAPMAVRALDSRVEISSPESETDLQKALRGLNKAIDNGTTAQICTDVDFRVDLEVAEGVAKTVRLLKANGEGLALGMSRFLIVEVLYSAAVHLAARAAANESPWDSLAAQLQDDLNALKGEPVSLAWSSERDGVLMRLADWLAESPESYMKGLSHTVRHFVGLPD